MRTETRIRHHLGVCLASDVAIMGRVKEGHRCDWPEAALLARSRSVSSKALCWLDDTLLLG